MPASMLVDEAGKNASRIECPGCGCIILQTGIGTFIDEHEVDVPLIRQKTSTPAASSNAESAAVETEKLTQWWFVTDMFAFENIGFTRAHLGRKFLACADCEIGPLGVVEEATADIVDRYLLSIERIERIERMPVPSNPEERLDAK